MDEDKLIQYIAKILRIMAAITAIFCFVGACNIQNEMLPFNEWCLTDQYLFAVMMGIVFSALYFALHSTKGGCDDDGEGKD